MKGKKLLLIFAALIVTVSGFSQEICDNGIDDDSDGLVDLNDTTDCNCDSITYTPSSLIPNPSFEDHSCCPSSFSQLYCADTWIQATDATSDYFNCGYNFGAATNAGISAYDGSAYVGAIFSPGWQEYVGSCLPTPLTAGIQYTIEMNIASTPMDDYGNVCNGGTIDYGPIDITIFGHANCSQLPYSTEVCPGGGWYVLATQTYTPVSSWGTISLSFIPSANVGAVMIGSPCTLPSGYSGACFPYFYFDNLILNETEAFNLVSVTQSGNLCSDDLMLTASSSGSGTYQWYYEGVAITGQTGTTLDVSSAGYGAGTYQVMFTDDDGTPGIVGCSIAEIVVVQDIVNITIDNTQDISCYGVADGSISITPSGGTEPYTYSWIGPGGYTSTDEDISELSAGTYNVTVTDVNECTAEDDMQLTANPNPTASITPDPAEMCPGETLTMDGNPSGGSGVWSTHLWTGDTGPLSATNVQNPDFSTTSAGTYNLTYTITDDNGCTGTDAVSVTVNPAPPVDLGADQTHCDYDVPVTIDAGLGMTSYEWSNDETTQTIEVTESGTYIVTVTNDQSCTASDEIEVTVNPSPEPDLGEDIIECEYNTPVILDAGSGASFLWSNGGTTSTINVSNSDNYIVTVTDTYGCTGEDDINLVVNPDLEPDAGEDIVVCSYDYVMDGSSTDSGTEGTWEQLSGPVAASIANENDPNTTVSVNMYGVYEFIWRVEYLDGSGCWGSDTVTVEFYTIIGTIYAENPLCHNSSDGMAWVIVNGGVPPYSYLWTDGQDTDTATNLSAGWQNVTITDANDCQISKEIYLTPPNEIIVSGLGNRQICIGGTANINIAVTGGTPPYSYFWQGSNGDTWYGSQLSVSPGETTVYTLVVTDANGCTKSGSATVNVYPELQIESFYATNDSICRGESTDLEFDITGGNGGPYEVVLNGNNIVTSPHSVSPTYSMWYVIRAADACETPAVYDSVYITVLDLPGNNFMSDISAACPPAAFEFNALNPNSSNTYQWVFGDDAFAYGEQTTHIYENSGYYDVTLLVTDQYGCTKRKTKQNMIRIYPVPDIDFYTKPDNLSMLNPEVEFYPVTSNTDSLYWYFGDGDSTVSSRWSPVHTYDGVGVFEIEVIGVNRYTCRDTIWKVIKIDDYFTFYAPTGFTPNYDGENDCFSVCGAGIDPNEFSITIFDRWGEIVFETKVFDKNAGCEGCGDGSWDGTMQGDVIKGDELLPSGTYPWICVYKDVFGIEHTEDGVVKLIR